MLAFMRDPVPPARIRKPVEPKPANSSSDVDDGSEVAAAADVGRDEMTA